MEMRVWGISPIVQCLLVCHLIIKLGFDVYMKKPWGQAGMLNLSAWSGFTNDPTFAEALRTIQFTSCQLSLLLSVKADIPDSLKRYQICFLLLQVPKLLSHDAARNNAGTRSTRRQQDNHTNDNVKPPNKGQLMCGELLQRKTLYTDCVSWWQFRGPFCPACFHHSSLVLVILYDFDLGNCTAFREA